MGMFDEIYVSEELLPEEVKEIIYWQTKSFYSSLDWFTIEKDKKLRCTRGKFLGELNYTGVVEIHGHKKWHNPYYEIKSGDKFYSYLLEFENGLLIHIEENKE